MIDISDSHHLRFIYSSHRDYTNFSVTFFFNCDLTVVQHIKRIDPSWWNDTVQFEVQFKKKNIQKSFPFQNTHNFTKLLK